MTSNTILPNSRVPPPPATAKSSSGADTAAPAVAAAASAAAEQPQLKNNAPAKVAGDAPVGASSSGSGGIAGALPRSLDPCKARSPLLHCHAATTKVLALSLYGSDPRYLAGAVRNAEIARDLLPDWTLHVYVAARGAGDPSLQVPQATLDALRANGAVLVALDAKTVAAAGYGMMWRFLAADELPRAARFAVRDADTRLLLRDRYALDDWEASGRAFHVVRDHPAHSEHAVPGERMHERERERGGRVGDQFCRCLLAVCCGLRLLAGSDCAPFALQTTTPTLSSPSQAASGARRAAPACRRCCPRCPPPPPPAARAPTTTTRRCSRRSCGR